MKVLTKDRNHPKYIRFDVKKKNKYFMWELHSVFLLQ